MTLSNGVHCSRIVRNVERHYSCNRATDGASGVQRLLDARGQRGSLENICYLSPEISDDLFVVIYQNFSLFRISCQISRKPAP